MKTKLSSKTKLIAGLTALSVLAFPISALAAQKTPQVPAPSKAAVCSVAGCQISGNHTHTQEHVGHSTTEHSQGSSQTARSYHGTHH